MTTLTKGSLCSGYGGLEAALPGTLRFVAEVNEDANAVLAREYPLVPNLGDITARRWTIRDDVSLLAAGFPCQPVSAAGRQKAQGDHRWLWPAVLNVIRCTRPAEVFLENVQNIVSIQGGAILAEILTGLRDAHYDCRWTVLGACAIGAPHHRHRWFLRGRRTTDRRTAEAVRLINKCGAPRTGGRILLPTPQARDYKGASGYAVRAAFVDDLPTVAQTYLLLPTPNARDGGARGTPSPEHALRRVAHPERSINLEDAAIAYLLPSPNVGDSTGGHSEPVVGGRRPSGAKRMDSLNTVVRLAGDRWGKFAPAIALWETITGLPAPEATEPGARGGRRLNPALSEWMMGLPPGLVTKNNTRSAALRLAGNGVVPAHAAAAFDLLGDER